MWEAAIRIARRLEYDTVIYSIRLKPSHWNWSESGRPPFNQHQPLIAWITPTDFIDLNSKRLSHQIKPICLKLTTWIQMPSQCWDNHMSIHHQPANQSAINPNLQFTITTTFQFTRLIYKMKSIKWEIYINLEMKLHVCLLPLPFELQLQPKRSMKGVVTKGNEKNFVNCLSAHVTLAAV